MNQLNKAKVYSQWNCLRGRSMIQMITRDGFNGSSTTYEANISNIQMSSSGDLVRWNEGNTSCGLAGIKAMEYQSNTIILYTQQAEWHFWYFNQAIT